MSYLLVFDSYTFVFKIVIFIFIFRMSFAYYFSIVDFDANRGEN